TLLKTQPDDLVGRVGDLVERLKQTEKEMERIRLAQLLSGGAALAEGAQDVNGVRLVAQRLDGAGGGDVRTLATDVRARLSGDAPTVVVLIGTSDGKAAIVAALNDAAQARGLAAGELVRAAAPFLDGKGGGKADLAQGGGTDVTRIDEALAAVTAAVAQGQ
ncbi:DHHA1 domain-containing protein, partial [Nocardioides albidus]|uniref:DHHA1 domain-containing protein n=1 Tax=Nocardioides albidus TaxID=1517589 RepID=UPI001F0094E5